MEAIRILSPSQNCIRALWKLSFSFLFLHDCLYFKLNIWMHFYPQLSWWLLICIFQHVIHCELCFRYFLNICREKKCVVMFLSWHKYAVDHMLYRKVIHSFQIWKWKPVWNSSIVCYDSRATLLYFTCFMNAVNIFLISLWPQSQV